MREEPDAGPNALAALKEIKTSRKLQLLPAAMDSNNGEKIYHQTRRCNNSSNGDYLPAIWEEPNDKVFGHHSMSYLDIGRDINSRDRLIKRGMGTHRHNYIETNTVPHGVEEEHSWDDYVHPDRSCQALPPRNCGPIHPYSSNQQGSRPYEEPHCQSFREQDFLETPSLVETAATNSAEDCREASLSSDDLNCKPPALSFETTKNLGTSSFQKDMSFPIKKSLGPSQQRNRYCYDTTPKKFNHHHHHQRHHQDEEPKPSFRSTGPTIEIAPGEFRRLRGAAETWKAVQVDFYVPCTCVVCNQTVFCIQDADFVLCPMCRVVSPVDGADIEEADAGRAILSGGVGLGFTFDDLAKWQDEIAVTRLHESTAW